MASQQHMSRLRMNQPVEQAAVDIDTHPHAGAYRDVDGALGTLGRAPGHLPQNGAVYVRIEAHRHIQRIFQRSYHIAVFPSLLGSLGDISIGFGILVQIQRTEASHSQSLYVPPLKVIDQIPKCLFRLSGGEGNPVHDFSALVPYGAYHFGAAGLDSSN